MKTYNKSCSHNVSDINIRATADCDFWGTKYNHSIYLFEGAKHNLTLQEIESLDIPTLKDLFATETEIQKAHDFCKDKYFKLLPTIARRLNNIHNLDLPVSFWMTVLGFWLLRHISCVYEKYSYLMKLDINETSIKLLDQNSFYIPRDHIDYIHCFCNDFGVQQIVSLYYHLYADNKFQQYSKQCDLLSKKTELYRHMNLVTEKKDLHINKNSGRHTSSYEIDQNLQIAICGAYYAPTVLEQLQSKSNGKINILELPPVFINPQKADMTKRQVLLDQNHSDDFEHFLIQTLPFCFPQILIEYFKEYYTVFTKNIKKSGFKHIVSEVWRSFLPTSIYLAISQYHGKKLIFQQHGLSAQWRSIHFEWLEQMVADVYITTGWQSDDPKIIRGGWASREIHPQTFNKANTTITFISSTAVNYLYEMSGIKTNSRIIQYLQNIQELIEILPESLVPNFVFRPRRASYLWDTEHTLNIDNNKFTVDTKSTTESFSQLLDKSRIVIIDHLTTGLAEILSNDIPCLILHDTSIDYLAPKFTQPFYKDLLQCGIIHKTPRSIINFLEKIYPDVESWWTSTSVRSVLRRIIETNIAPPTKTVDYLLSCLDDN